ncbi:hypothetical protein PGT21_007186 [Puccinia graminis f. sp. tritici]|uniref:Uncharacterized protein n=1 Tax=Puccinia graminis f. sp. tritici TaxID=56615 RepID=A0A5B0NKH2_PUCGR|nr:hypothetical protein PGT21_007186 [Puccinia graminis f. sp. tritici]
MVQKFVILLAIGLAFTVSASLKEGIITGSSRPTIITRSRALFRSFLKYPRVALDHRALTQPLAPPQRIIVHQPPAPQGVPIGVRPFNHQQGAGPLAVHPQPPPATQAGVGVPVKLPPGCWFLPPVTPQTSPPASQLVHVLSITTNCPLDSSAGQPRLMTPAGCTSYQLSAEHCPFSCSLPSATGCSNLALPQAVKQVLPVTNNRALGIALFTPKPCRVLQSVKLRLSPTIRSRSQVAQMFLSKENPMTSSRVVPPAPTTNEARALTQVHLSNPSQPAHEPDPSTQPSSSAPPGKEFSLVFGIPYPSLECFVEIILLPPFPSISSFPSGACSKFSPQTSLSAAEIFPPSGSLFPISLIQKRKKPA